LGKGDEVFQSARDGTLAIHTDCDFPKPGGLVHYEDPGQCGKEEGDLKERKRKRMQLRTQKDKISLKNRKNGLKSRGGHTERSGKEREPDEVVLKSYVKCRT